MINNGQPAVFPQQYWRKKYPAIVSGLFAVIQFILAILIIGCEIGSMLIDIITATIYVGLWSGLFFLIASISQAISCMFFVVVLCLCKRSQRIDSFSFLLSKSCICYIHTDHPTYCDVLRTLCYWIRCSIYY